MTCKAPIKPLYYIQLLFMKVSIYLKDFVIPEILKPLGVCRGSLAKEFFQ